MKSEKKYTLLEILSGSYFLIVLFVMACKFGLFLKLELREKLFDVFYYWCSTIILAIAVVIFIVLMIRSRRDRNLQDISENMRDLAAIINIVILSFEFIASLFGTLTVKKIAYEWFQLTIYVNMIALIIDQLVYVYVRSKLLLCYGGFDQKEVINKYIVYGIIVALLLGVIIPNLMLHFGIMEAIRASRT